MGSVRVLLPILFTLFCYVQAAIEPPTKVDIEGCSIEFEVMLPFPSAPLHFSKSVLAHGPRECARICLEEGCDLAEWNYPQSACLMAYNVGISCLNPLSNHTDMPADLTVWIHCVECGDRIIKDVGIEANEQQIEGSGEDERLEEEEGSGMEPEEYVSEEDAQDTNELPLPILDESAEEDLGESKEKLEEEEIEGSGEEPRAESVPTRTSTVPDRTTTTKAPTTTTVAEETTTTTKSTTTTTTAAQTTSTAAPTTSTAAPSTTTIKATEPTTPTAGPTTTTEAVDTTTSTIKEEPTTTKAAPTTTTRVEEEFTTRRFLPETTKKPLKPFPLVWHSLGCVISFEVARPDDQVPVDFVKTKAAHHPSHCAHLCYRDGCSMAGWDPNSLTCYFAFGETERCSVTERHYEYEAKEFVWVQCMRCKFAPFDFGQ